MPDALNKNQFLSNNAFIKASPLWTRAPTRSKDGKGYSDFMLLIPRLNKSPKATIENKMLKIQQSLEPFVNIVVYIDLNLKLNILWISIKPVPGMCKNIIYAIQDVIPEARVVASDMPPRPKKHTPWYLRLAQTVNPGWVVKRLK